MSQWYYPVKRHQSSDLVFNVVFQGDYRRFAADGTYVRTYARYIEYPIVGIQKDGDLYRFMLADGYVTEWMIEDEFYVYSAEQGNSWGTVHGEHYLANTWNGKAREEAMEKGSTFYPFSSVVKHNGRYVPYVLGYVPTKPQRNDTWSQLQTASERARVFA